jgi:hypothetical protein
MPIPMVNINTLDVNSRCFVTFQRQAQDNPLEFIRYYFGFVPWYDADSYNQRDILTKRMACQGDIFDAHANGTGKTSATVAAAVTLYIQQWPDIIVPAFAPSEDSVKRTFWAYAHSLLVKGNVKTKGKLFEWLGEPDIIKWNHPKVQWSYMQGYSPKTGGTGQGRKGQKVVIIIEEATDVPDAVWTAIDGLRMQGDSVMYVNANPLIRDCKAYLSLWDNPLVECHSLPATAHPNVKYKLDPKDPRFIKGAVTCEDIERLKQKCIKERNDGDYGKHPDWQARVLGIWPAEGYDEILVSHGWLERACKGEYSPKGQKKAGIDAAREGRDAVALTVWYHGERHYLHYLQKWVGSYDTIESCDMVEPELRRNGLTKSDAIDVDLGGNPGIRDELARRGWNARGIRFNNKPFKADDFNMRIDEMAYGLREAYRDDTVIHNPQLVGTAVYQEYCQGCQRRLRKTQGGEGKKTLESKDQFKKRNEGDSPDIWDSAVIGFGENPPMADGCSLVW